MGLFDGLFGSKQAALDAQSQAAQWIDRSGALAEFAAKANDRVEVIPGDGSLYAYVGKPPKAFGIVWFDEEGRHDVRSAMEQGAMVRDAAAQLVNQLGKIYETNASAERFEYHAGGHKIVVTPSSEMYAAVRDAIGAAMSS